MNAILRVNLEPNPVLLAVVLYVLVHPCRAEARFKTLEAWEFSVRMCVLC